jgi:hypothetical protein
MDVAALVISVFAILLSVIVAGWAIYLQWCMFKATTDQLTAIGKENASLAERIAKSLGQLHEAATSTKGSLDRTIDRLLSAVVARPTLGSAAAPADEQLDQGQWRIQRAKEFFGEDRAACGILRYLTPDGRERAEFTAYLTGPDFPREDAAQWIMDVGTTFVALAALDLIDLDAGRDRVVLTDVGREVARALGGRGGADGSAGKGTAHD